MLRGENINKTQFDTGRKISLFFQGLPFNYLGDDHGNGDTKKKNK